MKAYLTTMFVLYVITIVCQLLTLALNHYPERKPKTPLVVTIELVSTVGFFIWFLRTFYL